MFAPGATAQLDERTTQAFAMQEQRIDAAPAEVPTLQRGFIDAPVIEVDLTSGTERIMTLAPQPQAPAAYTAAAAPPPMKMRVTVPAGSSPGQQLSVQTARGLMTVVVPADAHSGQSFDFVLPSDRPDDTAMSPLGMLRVTVPANVYGGQPLRVQMPNSQLAQVTVPPGLLPGQAFNVSAAAQPVATFVAPPPAAPQQPLYTRVRVTVPPGVGSGQPVLVQSPVTRSPVRAVVPPGLGPGMMFDVMVPAAAA